MDFSEFKGKALLIVNTASKCGECAEGQRHTLELHQVSRLQRRHLGEALRSHHRPERLRARHRERAGTVGRLWLRFGFATCKTSETYPIDKEGYKPWRSAFIHSFYYLCTNYLVAGEPYCSISSIAFLRDRTFPHYYITKVSHARCEILCQLRIRLKPSDSTI